MEQFTALAVFGMVLFAILFVGSLAKAQPVAPPVPAAASSGGWISGTIVLLIALMWLCRGGPIVGGFPRSLFEESRLGVTRSDVHERIQEMERHVPDTLRDMESRLPAVSADIERQMMKDAYKYGVSESDIRAQLRTMETQARTQIRDMEPDVRREIRNLEGPVWDELQRLDRGR